MTRLEPAGQPVGEPGREKRVATWAGIAVNLPLAAGKIAVGYLAQSQALIADGVHSLSDLVSDVVVLAAIRQGGKAADFDHPYGHGRFETAATAFVGLLLVLAGLGIAWDAGKRMFSPETLLVPGAAALVVALVALALKEALYRYTIRVARRLRSGLLEANAWHHRSDALSSFVAAAGIAGSMAGLAYLDAVGAVIIAAMLVHVGWRHGRRAVGELVDTGLGPRRIGKIGAAIRGVPGVAGVRGLRTRSIGGAAYADVGVLVDPRISVSEAHRISEAVRSRLLDRIDEVADICVHVEPDGHADAPAAHALPLRDTVLHALEERWAGLDTGAVKRVTLHYLDDAIEMELVFAPATDPALIEALAGRARQVDGVRSVEALVREGG
jgi:cation diffusion facilitator family transporter